MVFKQQNLLPQETFLTRAYEEFARKKSATNAIASHKEAILSSCEQYYLLPFSHADLNHSHSLELLAALHNQNLFAFGERCALSLESVKESIQNLLLHEPDRLLFWVCDFSGEKIGHLGIKLTKEPFTIEVENIIKHSTSPGAMSIALDTLAGYCAEILQSKRLIVHILQNNIHAIQFHKDNGFTPFEKTFLKWEGTQQSGHLVPSQEATRHVLIGMEKLLSQADLQDS